MSETNEDQAGRIVEDVAAAGLAGVVSNLRGVLHGPNVAACLAAVAGVLVPVAMKAVAEAIRDPEVQVKLGEAGGLLFRPREG